MSIVRLSQELESLYSSYGYSRYAMSKFEEYALYLDNKDFLLSDRVVTFTDTDGRLMALKPDVTLSIIKNSRDDGRQVQKLCYQENVYRPGKSDQGIREILQLGLECIGQVDDYCIFEVLLLAYKSLQRISPRSVLDISHMGLISRLLKESGLSGGGRKQVLAAISGKNTHEIRRICAQEGVESRLLEMLTQLYGTPAQVMPVLQEIFGDAPELLQLKLLVSALCQAGATQVNIDFSVVNDMGYYNGIIFRGFVEGVPTGVLSGGQYDALMQKMHRTGGAIGFALYPDLLEQFYRPLQPMQQVSVLYYGPDASVSAVAAAVESLKKQGLQVSAQPGEAPRTCARGYQLVNNEVKIIENNA